MNDRVPGVQPDYMDLTVNPGVDFYEYCNGAWIRNTEIPADKSSWDAFTMLAEQNRQQLKDLFAELADAEHPDDSNAQKIADFYASGMDEERIEKAGAKPLAGELNRIDSIRTMRTLADTLTHLHKLNVEAMFYFGPAVSFRNSSMVIGHAVQDGLGLPDESYYLEADENSQTVRSGYSQLIEQLFGLLGDKPGQARRGARIVMAIETQLASNFMPKSKARNPENINHEMSMTEFQALIPNFPMHRYFEKLGAPTMETLNVMQPEYFQALNALLETVSLRDWKIYLRWQLVKSMASSLSSAFNDAIFEFWGRQLSGIQQPQPRWKAVMNMTGSALGEAIGQLYVERHFPEAAKAQVLNYIELCREALRETIEAMDWMSASTRQNALAKLEKFEPMIGYPDTWQDYTDLPVDRYNFAANRLAAARFAKAQALKQIGQPVDRRLWSMAPQTVNAYASQQKNQIVFPAAILQPPFFDGEAPAAVNFGSICAVICHEITHLFDDKGSKYDADGNVKMWWSTEDYQQFRAAMDLIVEQFNGFTVPSGKHINGELVNGEAAADLGGIKIAYRALQKHLMQNGRTQDANGFTDEQQFFIAFAQLWAGKMTDSIADLQVTTDPHPPEKCRVNGTLAHVAEFAQAFGLPDDAPLMLPPEKRCTIW